LRSPLLPDDELPPLNVCCTVFEPSQPLANHSPPDLFHRVIPIASLVPGSPLSVNVSCKQALPSTGIVFTGSVMSWMLALPLNVAVPLALLSASDVIELLFTW
jgi:hypothetical protein